MKKLFTISIVTTMFFATINSNAQAPNPLGIADFPQPLDSIFIKESTIPPTETFADSTSANDSLSIDRTLQKAIQSLGDSFMDTIQTGGADLNWQLVTFYYTPLPNPNNWNKVWNAPNIYVPGATAFPTANVYYQGITSGLTTYNFYRNDTNGFYELGSRVMAATPYNMTNTPAKPYALYPVDYGTPANIVGQHITTTASTMSTASVYDVTVDAYGTMTIVTGTFSNPISTVYPNCTRLVTYSIDTMDAGSGMFFYVESKFYNWYTPGVTEPIVTYSVAQVRNNIDPLYWSMDPGLAWHDEIEMSFGTPYVTTGFFSQTLQDKSCSIFPNPSNGIFTLRIGKEINSLNKVEVLNNLGQIVYQNLAPQTGELQINLSQLNKGEYFVKMYFGEKCVTNKIIVK